MRTGRIWLSLGGAVALTVAWATTASAVSWDNVTPYVDSGKSTTALQKLVWSPSSSTALAAVDDAYRTGLLSADGAPGLAQVYGHPEQQMYYKTDANCGTAKSAIADADAQYTLAAWCFTGDDETSDAWLPQGVVQRPNSTSGRPEFFVARTVTGGHDSELWYEQDGDGVCAAKGVFVDDTESITYWVDSSGNGHLWTFTEYGGRRMLVRVYTKEYNDPPSGCPTQ